MSGPDDRDDHAPMTGLAGKVRGLAAEPTAGDLGIAAGSDDAYRSVPPAGDEPVHAGIGSSLQDVSTTDRRQLVPSIEYALFGTTDGDLLGDDDSLPVGELRRLLRDVWAVPAPALPPTLAPVDGETVHDVARTLLRLAPAGEERREAVEQLARIPLFADLLDWGEDPEGDGHPTIREWADESPESPAQQPADLPATLASVDDLRVAAGDLYDFLDMNGVCDLLNPSSAADLRERAEAVQAAIRATTSKPDERPPYTRGWRIGDRVRVRATGERGVIDAALEDWANVRFTDGKIDHFPATDLQYDRAAHDRCDREFCGHDRWLHNDRSKRCTAGAQRDTSAWRCECAEFIKAARSPL